MRHNLLRNNGRVMCADDIGVGVIVNSKVRDALQKTLLFYHHHIFRRFVVFHLHLAWRSVPLGMIGPTVVRISAHVRISVHVRIRVQGLQICWD